MEFGPRRQTQSNYYSGQPSSKPSEMAMLTATPAPPAGFYKDYSWDNSRFPSYPAQSTQASTSVSLPSIRHQFPDLLPQQESQAYAHTAATSPSSTTTGHATSPTYVHSPVSNKRRRDSVEDEQERERARQVPRLYHSPEYTARRPPSPAARPTPSAAETWGQPVRATPYPPSRSRVPAPVEVHERVEPRPSLPSLPSAMGMDRPSASRPPTRDRHTEDYRDTRPPLMAQQAPPAEPVSRCAPTTYEHQYRHPSQVSSTSPTHHSFDRTPFSAGPYSRSYGDYSRFGDLGHMGIGGDSKQRKRRGNLPKETTDKLRAWFMSHLSHPYPTEDEKQELMRQTGLQMNQISNWFINARRRQLPTMISNARVESDAISGRGADGKILPTTERVDLHAKREGLTLSDGEGGVYDDELESLKRHRGPAINRGSV